MSRQIPRHILVFTDLDGTLLDHDTYSAEAAVPMLANLKQQGIPVIPNTSKTFTELLSLREQLDLDTPFIVENGAAIHIPHGFFPVKPAQSQWQEGYWVKQFTSRRQHWVHLIKQEQREFAGMFSHFSNMTVQQVVDATGLSSAEAELSMQRQFGEPVLWLGDEQSKQRFLQRMRARGAHPLQGGRFIHISGESDKGSALRWLVEEFNRQYPQQQHWSIALGDGQNDVAMLEAADVAVRILSPAHAPPAVNKANYIYTSREYGPAGWTEMLSQILNEQFKEA